MLNPTDPTSCIEGNSTVLCFFYINLVSCNVVYLLVVQKRERNENRYRLEILWSPNFNVHALSYNLNVASKFAERLWSCD